MIPAGTEVVVVGGGAAGLSAALAIQELGGRPLVLEAAPRVGGRARSFHDRRSGERLDNGPHILVGACTATLALLTRLGTRGHLHDEGRVALHFWSSARHTMDRLACPTWLPAPFHLLAGLARFAPAGGAELLAAVRLGLTLPWQRWQGQSVTQWLLRHGQTSTLFKTLWEPLCLAVMNEPPASADAALFAAVLKRAFFRERTAGRLLLPTVPLAELLAEPARALIEARGGRVLTGVRVTRLEARAGRIERLHTRQGCWPVPNQVICALPPWAAAGVLPEGWGAPLAALASAPIVSVHLTYASPLRLPAPVLGLPGQVSQWLVQRSGPPDEARISAVISGAYREAGWSSERLGATVHRELTGILPQLPSPAHVRVVKERRATPAQWPGLVRLPSATPWRNLQLAGDWLDTGLPATIESAVLSGQTAASQAAGR